MTMYDDLKVSPSVTLPHFPSGLDHAVTWQTKSIGHPTGQTYKLTTDGRLLRRETKQREKTPEEKQAEAEDHGVDSWDEYKSQVEDGSLEDNLKNDFPPFVSKQTTEDTWWADHNMHGSFEFHASGSRRNDWPDFTLSYEARFTRGSLDEIVFLGDRHNDLDLDDAIDQLSSN